MENMKRTLLVVDDEPDLREILVFAFERKGYLVFEAGNAVEALEVVKRNKIDVIISDIRMPGGDGIQLLEGVKKMNPNIPTLLFVTGFADISFEEAYDMGCEAIFSKPFDTKVLVTAVENLLQAREDKWSSKRDSRKESRFKIDLKFSSFDGAQKAHVLNIGRGGFFIGMSENFPKVGDPVSFRMHFDEGFVTVIEGDGLVKWVRREAGNQLPPGCGVEFVSLDDTTKAKIFELNNFLRTQQYIPKG
jgi:two-component system response regulator (stage 0 sporulation protein F)